MMIMLKAVTTYGTAGIVSTMHHPFGGKTGTTNSFTDAWFLGFSPSVTCGVWVGYDNRQTLGAKETGGKAALPIWMDFMATVIEGKEKEQFPSANAPKKVLEVPVTQGSAAQDSESDKQPAGSDDPDADGDSPPSAAKPAAAPPVVPMAIPNDTPSDEAPAPAPAKPAPIVRVPPPSPAPSAQAPPPQF